MERYKWNILGISELRWKGIGEITTDKGNKLYFSGREDRHEHGVGFLVNKDTADTVMGCCPVSSRLITIRMRAAPFNITIIQTYAPTTDYDDSEVEDFYEQLQAILNQVRKKDIIIVQGDWNAKVAQDTYHNWRDTQGPHCNNMNNDRGLRLLEFARYNNLILANTLGQHKKCRRWTWHSPNGEHHNQIDYIMIKNRFRSSVNTGKTRTYPGADIGSDHDLVMMSFQIHLKRMNKAKCTRPKFNFDKLKDPEVQKKFQATINKKFAPLLTRAADKLDVNDMTNIFNSAMTDAATELLGKRRPIKKPWVTHALLDLCDRRRDMKKKGKHLKELVPTERSTAKFEKACDWQSRTG